MELFVTSVIYVFSQRKEKKRRQEIRIKFPSWVWFWLRPEFQSLPLRPYLVSDFRKIQFPILFIQTNAFGRVCFFLSSGLDQPHKYICTTLSDSDQSLPAGKKNPVCISTSINYLYTLFHALYFFVPSCIFFVNK